MALSKKNQLYVQEQAQKIYLRIVENKLKIEQISTSNLDGFDKKLHTLMLEIALELKKIGVKNSAVVKGRIFNWEFSIVK